MFGMGRFAHLIAPAAAIALLSCSGSPDGGTGPTDPDPNDNLVCNIPTDLFFSSLARDAIPSLTNPDVGPAAASVMGVDDRVLGLVVGGEARAYPIGVLWWHEVINDTLGGEPVLVSYCPLTGSGIAFDPRVDGGEARNFGVSGILLENNLVMFDRTTESLWNQMLLGSQCGPDRGKSLTRLPIVETNWGHWKRLHPNTSFVTTNTGFLQDYTRYPYDDYDDLNNPNRLFPGSRIDTRRPPKELVLGVHEDTLSVAFPFGALTNLGLVVALNDSIGATPLLVTFFADEQTAIAFDRRINGQTLTFDVADPFAGTLTDRETGSTWSAAGEAIGGSLTGARLTQHEDAFVAFWFAWSIYFPTTRLVQ